MEDELTLDNIVDVDSFFDDTEEITEETKETKETKEE